MTKRALILQGGWDGHQPRESAELFGGWLRTQGYDVQISDTMEALLDPELSRLALIVPMWTMGGISQEQLAALEAAVRSGVGLGGFHGGMGDAFRNEPGFQFMVGGQFVAHPDDIKTYVVRITRPEDPIVAGLRDFEMRSEQYYMHVDPANEVLATTVFDPVSAPWVKGVEMPVAWKRRHGAGRVFYCSLGHTPEDFRVPEALALVQRGLLWAARP